MSIEAQIQKQIQYWKEVRDQANRAITELEAQSTPMKPNYSPLAAEAIRAREKKIGTRNRQQR